MNKVAVFDESARPQHIAAAYGDTDTNSDMSNGVMAGGYPIISYKGKVWHVVEGDTKTLVANEDGDPKASIEVVLLKSNPNLSKLYYVGGYEEGSTAKPTCFSNDGIAPDSDSATPQAKKCAICPHNAWGSRVTEQGKKGKACSDLRRVAVAPTGDLERPMLLRIPAGTLKDLSAYADTLNKRKAPYSAVVTRIAFDHSVAHQKFTFKAIRWLSVDEVGVVGGVQAGKSDIIGRIVGMNLQAAATSVDEDTDELGDAPAYIASTAKPAPKVIDAEPVQAPKPERKPSADVIDAVDASLDEVLGLMDD